jgi:hypothetical protein
MNTKKIETSDTKFSLCSEDKFNAFAYTESNRVEIGKEIFTLESLVHELSEIDVTMIIEKEFKEVNAIVEFEIDSKKHRFSNYLSHFASPYGGFSAINPSKTRYGERAKHEEFLI